jgi:hypothetical protein
MILIEKHFEDVTTITESDSNGDKKLYVTGVFAQTNVANRNNRIYSESIFDPAAKSFTESMVKTNRALGELDHPADGGPRINAERACLLITEFNKDGNNYIGKARILEGTPLGDVVAGLIRNGVQGGMSTRGSGSVKLNKNGINEIQAGYKLFTVDFVLNPSAPDAFVSSIVESDGLLTLLSNNAMLEEFDRFLGQRKEIKQAKAGERYQMSISAFDSLLKSFKV